MKNKKSEIRNPKQIQIFKFKFFKYSNFDIRASSLTSGYIALMTSIILSAILIVVVATGSLSGYFSRSNVLESEFKERSAALSDACVDHILLSLVNDPNYIGGETLVLGGGNCTIATAAAVVPRVFKIKGIFQNSYTNVIATFTINPVTLTGWQEVATLP